MSSFIIDKKEYARAAGFAIGTLETARDDEFLKSATAFVSEAFKEIYRLNVKSYNLQYGADVAEDAEDYQPDGDVEKCGGERYTEDCGPSYIITRINGFLGSALYQIEDEECAAKAGKLAFEIMHELCMCLNEEAQFDKREQLRWHGKCGW